MTMSLRSRRVGLAAAALVVGIAGCAALLYFPTKPVVKNVADPSLVRGYLAAAVGRSADAERGGLYSRKLEAQDIHLPGVTVYLQDAASGTTSGDVRTDLSGRFTLLAPKEGQYRLCWKSPVYGAECFQTAFRAGHEPLFLSTLRVRIAPKKDHVASYGKVRFADDSPARTLEPFADVNAFATVRLLDAKKNLLAEVAVNNHGEYLLPHVPNNVPVTLVAAIEKTESAQDLLPDNYVDNPRVVRFHLTLRNTPPRLDAITPLDALTLGRVQVGAPGQALRLRAETRDRDGDPVRVQWLLNPGSGTLSAPTGAQVEWKLPAQPGRHSVTAIAGDGRGGYARYTVRLSVGAPGVPFGGVVVGTDGTLIDNADVEVNGKPEKTDAQGRFISFVPQAERYVFNIRKAGYGFYSRIYDRSVAGGRWTLVRASVAEFDPKLAIDFQDKRAPRNCPGPASARIDWDAGPVLKRVYWQDGKGNNIAPPFNLEGKAPPLPWQRKTGQKQECGPGISVRIPANGLQTAGGAAPTGKVELSLATVDLATPEQMPGDDTVRTGATTLGWMASYGAGSVALRDTGSGLPLNLKPGITAEVVIPVDAMQLAAGAPLSATMPLLFYDEVAGRWQQDGVLTLDAAKNYVAKVSHFSSLNADVVFTDPSCVRVQSSIPTPYELELTIPLPGGAAPKIKTITITDAPPHVIYALPNDTLITIVAIAPGGPGVPPRSLGVFIVNTGPPQAAGFGLPPPPTACATEVSLSVQTYPDVPDSGEFLHGLFAFSATTINESDIGTPGSASQLLDQATENYYAQIDPLPSKRATLTAFLDKNGFSKPPGFQLCAGAPCIDPDVEINAVYANSGDLGFGRDMHCRRTAAGAGFDYACYVTNYGDITTDDEIDAQIARANGIVVATVAMEFSRVAVADPVDDRHVKFYVYNAAGNRVNRADLDKFGLRPVPQLCMVCHGGAYPGGGTAGVPAFNTPASVKLGSRFLPFDTRFFTFPASPTKADQQVAIKRLNQDIVRNAPALVLPPPQRDAVADVIDAMYAGGSAVQLEEFVVDPWKAAELPNTAAQEQFYRRVVGNGCRTCHMAQPFANNSSDRAGINLQFSNARDFLRSQTITGGLDFSPFSSAEQRVCEHHVMPHAKRTHDIFWGQHWPTEFGPIIPTLAAQFQAFGETIKASLRPLGWPGGEPWPPAWNGEKCGAFTDAGAAVPSFYSTHIHILWSRSWGDVSCTTCHAGDLGGNAANTHAALIDPAGFFPPPGAVVVANNLGTSLLHQRVTGSVGGKMPQSCGPPPAPRRCLNDAPGAYNPAADAPGNTNAEIDRIEFWINNGAKK